MPPQQAPTPVHPHLKGIWFIGAFLVVLIIGILMGVGLAHSNSDYTCAEAVNNSQQGACTGGSWSGWTSVNGVQQRTYTGTQTNVSFAGQIMHSCSHPADTTGQATGQITTAYAACQIVETGTTVAGSGNGNGNGNSTTSVTVTGQTEITGEVSTSTQTSGNYTDYQNTADAVLATGTITALPSLVTPGATTQLVWSSSHVKTCTVTGSNGDSWTGGASPDGGVTSAPIAGQTTYTLACTTALGNTITSTAIVNLVPVFNER